MAKKSTKTTKEDFDAASKPKTVNPSRLLARAERLIEALEDNTITGLERAVALKRTGVVLAEANLAVLKAELAARRSKKAGAPKKPSK